MAEWTTEALEAISSSKDGRQKRALLAELVDPTIRAWFRVLHVYGRDTSNYLHFTENKKLASTGRRDPFITHRVHRVAREYLERLRRHAKAKRITDFSEEWAVACNGYDNSDETMAIMVLVAQTAACDFHARTEYLFTNPAILAIGDLPLLHMPNLAQWPLHCIDHAVPHCLPAPHAAGMADAKGHGVRTAKALIKMAQQSNQIGLLRALAKHVHSGVTVKQLRRAIFLDPEDNGILLFMTPPLWSLVIKFASRYPEATVLADVAELAPLHDHIKSCTRHVGAANDVCEHGCKVRASYPI